MILVSACLWGEPTRYDGQASACPSLKKRLAGREVLVLCPEVMGGLPVPRPAAAFVNASPGQEGQELLAGRARLIDATGCDVSQAFISGAQKVLNLALLRGVKCAYLKDRSPSCAYDLESLNPKGGPRLGVLAALLAAHGIEIKEVRMSSTDLAENRPCAMQPAS